MDARTATTLDRLHNGHWTCRRMRPGISVKDPTPSYSWNDRLVRPAVRPVGISGRFLGGDSTIINENTGVSTQRNLLKQECVNSLFDQTSAQEVTLEDPDQKRSGHVWYEVCAAESEDSVKQIAFVFRVRELSDLHNGQTSDENEYNKQDMRTGPHNSRGRAERLKC